MFVWKKQHYRRSDAGNDQSVRQSGLLWGFSCLQHQQLAESRN
jgi:hypothetical protein